MCNASSQNQTSSLLKPTLNIKDFNIENLLDIRKTLKDWNFPEGVNYKENSLQVSSLANLKDKMLPVPLESPILDVTSSMLSSSTQDSCDLSPGNPFKDHFPIPKNFNSLFVQNSNMPSMGVPFLNSNMLPLNSHNNKVPLPSFEYISPPSNPALAPNSLDFALFELNRFAIIPSIMQRRPRGEKRSIPEEQKDEKYYERRKRNNEAAKKSRDARKIREDRIALRAALLEQENSILRAQVLALRDELEAVRQLMGTNVCRSSGGV